MKEDLLKYLWKTQQFTKRELKTTLGQSIRIIKVGKTNLHEGPDFLAGKIILDKMTFHGDIEIHHRSSDWYAHKHERDARYNSVILHVVWENNRKVLSENGSCVPTLVLKGRVKAALLTRYKTIIKANPTIPCGKQFHQVSRDIRETMLEKMLLSRFDQKYTFLNRLFKKNNGNTATTTYHLLGYNFGFKVNSNTFLQLVHKVPFQLIQQYRRNPLHLEALLLGQAGFLSHPQVRNRPAEAYEKELLDSYAYLKDKHKLEAITLPHVWKFARLRPPNFPTIRIVQFAQLIHKHPNLFELLINSPFKELKKHFALKQSPYWQQHHFFGKKSRRKIGGLGEKSIENIVINSVVPLLITYGKIRKNRFFTQKAIDLLRSLPAEDNTITRQWQKIGFTPQNAFHSQASIQLFNTLCQYKKCLSCDIGKHLIRKKTNYSSPTPPDAFPI